MMSIPDVSHRDVDLGEAVRQLELAVHDAQVAYDTYAITARTAADAAEAVLRAALGPGANPVSYE